MRSTLHTSTPAASLAATAQEYTQRGWMVAETANGISLVTDDTIAGIEVSGELADGVGTYLKANKLSGPVVELPGSQRREIHLVTGLAKAPMALAALREMGAVVHVDGAGIPLPPTQLCAGSARWGIAPQDAQWVPPVVAIAAAVRATVARRRDQRVDERRVS